MSHCPLGWYWTANLGSPCHFISRDDRTNFFLCAFKSSTVLSVVNVLWVLDFLWQSGIVSPNSGLENLIFAASMFGTFLFMIQVLLK